MPCLMAIKLNTISLKQCVQIITELFFPPLKYYVKVNIERHSQPILFPCDFRVHVWNKNVLKMFL